MSRFLTETELIAYTGRQWKIKQIAALKKIGAAFIINACGKPVVTVAAVEGRKEAQEVLMRLWAASDTSGLSEWDVLNVWLRTKCPPLDSRW